MNHGVIINKSNHNINNNTVVNNDHCRNNICNQNIIIISIIPIKNYYNYMLFKIILRRSGKFKINVII